MEKQLSRPNIGFTGPDYGGTAMWIFASLSVYLAGGRAIRVTPSRPLSKSIDGLIIGGGSDVDSTLYGQKRLEFKEEANSFWEIRGVISKLISLNIAILRWLLRSKSAPEIDVKRDKLEQDLLSQSIDQGLPVLGICRGQQLMNVYAGGTLHQALSGHYQETKELRTIFPRKEIDLAPQSLLSRITKKNQLRVNALHRQGVDKIGSGLVACAVDKNKIVQAIESEKYDFFLGVQWHPEFLPYLEEQRSIFQHLVKSALENMQKTSKTKSA